MSIHQTSTTPAPANAVINVDGAARTITALLRKHGGCEWFINEHGNPVLVTQCSTYIKDVNDPLHGTVRWHVELDELTSIRQTLTLLGY